MEEAFITAAERDEINTEELAMAINEASGVASNEAMQISESLFVDEDESDDEDYIYDEDSDAEGDDEEY